ncbi:MAG: hypothetical protein HY298_18680 [Verrucomicrobia bacterium]|nr:hypothetical protein [Verrucomicrobiota bacterium]
MPKPKRLPDRSEQTVLEELQVELISPRQKPRWNQLVRKHHYLKSADLVGEQLRYVVTDAKGRWLWAMSVNHSWSFG